jgi:hypothetical protein
MKKLALLDVTTSDYFSGYHLPVFAISLYDGIAFEDVADQIEWELKVENDYYINEDGFSEEDEKLIYEFINEYKSKGDEIFYYTQKCNETMQKDADDYFDSDRFEYAYFSIVDMKTINGITFLS